MTAKSRSAAIEFVRQGDAHLAAGRLEQAWEAFDKARATYERILADGETPQALRSVSLGLGRLGDVELERGQIDAAHARYVRQLEIDRKILTTTGETPQALRDMSISLGRLGDVERMRGQLDAAYTRNEQKLEIDRRILAYTGEAPEALRALCATLDRLGALESMRGQLNAAYARHEEVLELDRKILSLTGETPGALHGLSVSIGWLGDLDHERGQLDAAYVRFEQRLEIAERIVALTGGTREALRILIGSLGRLGDVECERGQLDTAGIRYKQQLEVAKRILALTGETPEALRDLSDSLEGLGSVERARGQLIAAYARNEQKLEIDRKILALTGETPEDLMALSSSLGVIGGIEQALGQLDTAYARYEKRLEVARNILRLSGETPRGLHGLMNALLGLGDMERARGQLDAAYARFEQGLGIARKILAFTGETPRALRSLSICLARLGDMERERGQIDRAYARYEQLLGNSRRILALTGETVQALRDLTVSLALLGDSERASGHLSASVERALEQTGLLLRVNAQLAIWPGDAADLAGRLAALASAGALPVPDALSHRADLWKRLHEHVDLADVQVLEHAQAGVARFHAHWLRLVLEHAPDRLPEVLGAMQGRKIAALVLEELEQQPLVGESSELYQRFRRLRTELRRQALNLRAIGGGAAGRSREDDPRDRGDGGSGVSPEVWRAREAEYRATRAEYQACLAELAKQPGYEALQPPQMDAARLRHTLADGQALLIVLQPPAEGQTNSISQALLLRREGHQLVPLPGLHATIARVRSLAKAPQFVVGKRYAASRKFDNGNPAQALGEAMAEPATEALDLADSGERSTSADEAFWSPLAPHLQGLHTLHVVTHGELHMLPLAHESPGGIHLYQYPGLVFYWLQHKASEPHTADAGLVLQVHSPAQGEVPPPIPFVHAEAQLARSLWSPVHTLLPLQQEASPRVVHLAGHGEAGRGQEAALLVGPQQTLGLHELLRSRLRPEVVYLSACLVGRTSEDLDGDPLGMVSAFFLRGARSVVAPLVPISDLYAPILAGLFHWELKAQDDEGNQLDASRALQHAKARLNSGDWPEEIVQRVREAYAGTFGNEIAEILHGRLRGEDGRQLDPHRELMAAVRSWMFPVCLPKTLTVLRDEIEAMSVQQGPDAAARWGAERLADMLVDARDRLGQQTGVQELLRYMMVYGAPNAST